MTTTPSSFSTQLTRKQLDVLEAEFCISTRPDITTRDRLAQTLQLSNLFIHVWFQIRRSRLHHRQTRIQICHMRKHDINYRTVHPSISNKTSGKRKSPCDVHDHERMSQLTKKPATITASMPASSLSHISQPTCLSMTSSSCHPSCNGVIQHRASRDLPRGATSSLMSVEFLSRSSRTVCAPDLGARLLSGTPMCGPSTALPQVTYYVVN